VKSDQHVLIAGGGMVGLSLALLLDRQLPSGVRITLVEGTALPSARTQAPPTIPPSTRAPRP
jgi:2-octaprenyl-6-methoxyphenol hydroxylase